MENFILCPVERGGGSPCQPVNSPYLPPYCPYIKKGIFSVICYLEYFQGN